MQADGLLVFTSTNYKIHNSNFRKKLVKMAGKGYEKDLKELRQRMKDDENEEVRLTSGANLPFYAIFHVPIAPYKKDDDLNNYQKVMLQAMERGLNEAVNREFRRVVLCVCGLRSNDLLWEVAKEIAVKSMNYTAKTMHVAAALKELVIVTASRLHNDQINRALSPLNNRTAYNTYASYYIKPSASNTEQYILTVFL